MTAHHITVDTFGSQRPHANTSDLICSVFVPSDGCQRIPRGGFTHHSLEQSREEYSCNESPSVCLVRRIPFALQATQTFVASSSVSKGRTTQQWSRNVLGGRVIPHTTLNASKCTGKPRKRCFSSRPELRAAMRENHAMHSVLLNIHSAHGYKTHVNAYSQR